MLHRRLVLLLALLLAGAVLPCTWTAAFAQTGGTAPGGTPPRPAGPDHEIVFWQSIMNSTVPADFEAFERAFPNSVFLPLARSRLAALRARAHDCDRLAQPPRSELGRLPSFAEGVAPERMDGVAAEAACRRAVDQYPHEARFQAWLGRALARLDRDAEAVDWVRRAAEQGHAWSQFGLGELYASGGLGGVSHDDAEAVRWFRAAAEQGFAMGQHKLGLMYAEGRGVPRDDAEAVRWFRAAAAQGDPRSGASRTVTYGWGALPRDAAEVVRLYRAAAERGEARGQNNLGVMYIEGNGVPRDDAEAVRWFRAAAEQGDAAGQINLGHMYAEGRGVPRDDAEAVRWYRVAAEQGDVFAQVFLGDMYAEGRGVPRDDAEAVRWYRAARGYSGGQYKLGLMYAEGRGVPRDDAEALRWFRAAAGVR